jgi:parallel beta helix pectate lyase-like protein
VARRTFPQDRMAYRIAGPGSYLYSAATVKVTVYADEACTVPADIQALDGSPLPGAVLTVDATSLLPRFLGPVDGTTTLWVKGAGSVVALVADVETRVEDAEAALTAHLAAPDAHGDRADAASKYTPLTDPRLTNVRTPTAHAASHGSGGTDPVAVAQSQVTGLATILATLATQLPGLIQLTATADAVANATAINSAILTLSQRGGGRVQLSGDAWPVSASITPRSNVTLSGVPGTVITHTANSNIVYGNAVAFSNFTVEDIVFAGSVSELPTSPKRARATSGAGAQTAIFLTGDLDTTGTGQAQLTNFTMRRCTVQFTSALPIRIGGVRGRVLVTNCEFIGCQDAGFVFCEEVDFSHNHVYGGADNGVSLSRGCKKITCVGNRIENVAYNGIWVAGFNTDKAPQNFTVAGNVIRNVGYNGIYCDYAPRYGSITGNEIDCGYYRGPSDQPSDINGAGIYLGGYPTTDRANPTDWAQGITVIGNEVRTAARAGIYLNGVRRCQVIANLIEDTGTQFLANGTTAISSSDATQNVGILMENSSTSANVTIALNDVVDSRTPAYTNYGLVPQNTTAINAYLNSMTGTRQPSNVLETGPTRTWQSTQVFNQDIKATAGVTSGSNAGSGTIEGARVNGASGSVRAFVWQTAGAKRWYMRANGTAESGSNTGSDFELNAYDDAGNLLSTPLKISRANGQVTLGNGYLLLNSTSTVPSSNPTGGGILYVEAGALKYRGPAGTVTTIAAA